MNAASVAKTPTIQKRTVVRGRLPNVHYRTREYLTEREVERLMKAAGDNRHGQSSEFDFLMHHENSPVGIPQSGWPHERGHKINPAKEHIGAKLCQRQ